MTERIDLSTVRVKNIWALVQTEVAVDIDGFPDTPETWTRVIGARLVEGVTLVDVSDAPAASLVGIEGVEAVAVVPKSPLGALAFLIDSPSDQEIPAQVFERGTQLTADVPADWEPLIALLEPMGIVRDDFLCLPATLAVQLGELAFHLATVKKQAQDAGIPLGFQVGPIYWNVTE